MGVNILDEESDNSALFSPQASTLKQRTLQHSYLSHQQGKFLSNGLLDDTAAGSPTPTNGHPSSTMPASENSPIICIQSPVANLNPFKSSSGAAGWSQTTTTTSPRPCLGGTQSMRQTNNSSNCCSSLLDAEDSGLLQDASDSNNNNTAGGNCFFSYSSTTSKDTAYSSLAGPDTTADTSDMHLSTGLGTSAKDNKETKASRTASLTASAILNSILKESSQQDYERMAPPVEENLYKYMEEMTGLTPSPTSNRGNLASRRGNSQLNTTWPPMAASQQNDPTSSFSDELFRKYLVLKQQDQQCMSQQKLYSPPANRQQYNFDRPQRASSTAVDLSQKDQALLNSLSTLSPEAISQFFKFLELHNMTNYVNMNEQASLAQSLDLWSLQWQQMQNAASSHQETSNCRDQLATLLALNELQNTINSNANYGSNKCLASSTPNRHQHQMASGANHFHHGHNQHHQNNHHTQHNHHQNHHSQHRRGGASHNTQGLDAYLSSDIELAATSYRNSASSVAQRNNDVPMKWDGELPSRNYQATSFSRKVFLGGVPWEATSEILVQVFSEFGHLTVNWPQSGTDGHQGTSAGNNPLLTSPGFNSRKPTGPKGYCYLIFDYEQSVTNLLARCRRDPKTGEYYFSMHTAKLINTKDVQVIPWVLNDSQFGRQPVNRSENIKTVFIGALHGMITAQALALIMNSIFGNVIYAAIDTDKYKYPIGSGRVIFSSVQSYIRAVTENFVEVRTSKFNKIIQIDPYLEEATCSKCNMRPGIYFCRAWVCFSYFCPVCWSARHNTTQTLYSHKPLRRSWRQSNPNSNQQQQNLGSTANMLLGQADQLEMFGHNC